MSGRARRRTEEQMATAIASGEPARHRESETRREGFGQLGLNRFWGKSRPTAVMAYTKPSGYGPRFCFANASNTVLDGLEMI